MIAALFSKIPAGRQIMLGLGLAVAVALMVWSYNSALASAATAKSEADSLRHEIELMHTANEVSAMLAQARAEGRRELDRARHDAMRAIAQSTRSCTYPLAADFISAHNRLLRRYAVETGEAGR